MDRAIGSYERGLWPSRYTRWEAVSLKVQSRHDRRNVPLIWLWRYLNDDDRYGASPDSTYYEEPAIDRKTVGLYLSAIRDSSERPLE